MTRGKSGHRNPEHEREEHVETQDTWGEDSHVKTDTDWSYTVTNYGTSGAPRAWESKGRVLPRATGESTALPMPGIQTFMLQNCEITYFCCF